MTFDDLKLFLLKETHDTATCPPLIVRTLVESGGSATLDRLAAALLSSDEFLLRHVEKRLRRTGLRALVRSGIVTRQKDMVVLNLPELTARERDELKSVCERKIGEYRTGPAMSLLDDLPGGDPVPSSLRCRLLKEAKGRCALCGATKHEAPLEVRHLVPRSEGGRTVYENLRVVCPECSRGKHGDSTRLRAVIEKAFNDRCPFCRYNLEGEKPAENELAFVKPDARPITDGHSLIIPKRHARDWFDTTAAEQAAMNELLAIRRKQLLEADPTIEGFNVGMNVGEIAGQTVFHCHLHLVPRRKSDEGKVKGSVRGMIRDKMGKETGRT